MKIKRSENLNIKRMQTHTYVCPLQRLFKNRNALFHKATGLGELSILICMYSPNFTELIYLYVFTPFDPSPFTQPPMDGQANGYYSHATINITKYPSSYTYVSISSGQITGSRISGSNRADTFTFQPLHLKQQ